MASKFRMGILAATAIGGALAAGPAFTQSGGTVARYTLDAGTTPPWARSGGGTLWRPRGNDARGA